MGEWSQAGVAERWKETSKERNRHLAAATDQMFAFARIEPGMRVLDLGTGGGDVAMMAAERVGPSGLVLATDASEEMVAVARAAARDAGTANVTVRRMEVEAMDVPDASFDVVLARMVLMFVDDLGRALKEVARVLAPGGRFAATTWSTPANNPFHAAVLDVVREKGPLPEPLPEFVRAFRLSDPELLLEAARTSGLSEVEVRAVLGERRIASIGEEIARQKSWPLVAGLFASLDDAAKERAWTEVERRLRAFEDANGGGVFPTEMLALGAGRP